MFTERQAIREEMEWIRNEIRILKERYWSLSKRLSELDKEQKEAIDTEEIIFQLTNAVKTLSNIVPKPTVNQVIEGLRNTVENYEEIIEANSSEKFTIKTGDIEITKEREEKNRSIKTRRYQDLKAQVPLVIGILKEAGIPVKASTIANKMEEIHGIKWNNPSQVLSYICEYEPRIERAVRGFYQYK